MLLPKRSQSLRSRPLSEIPLSGSLLNLAWKVWENRITIKGYYDVYKLYSSLDRCRHSVMANSIGFTFYLSNLNRLAQMWRPSPTFQAFASIPFSDMVIARQNYLKHNIPISSHRLKLALSSQAKLKNMTIEDYLTVMMQSNRVFFKTGESYTAMHRVYLNVKPKEAVKVMTYVVLKIMDRTEGVKSAKIGIGNYTDTIVIYTKNIKIALKVIDKLKKYQQHYGVSAFIDKLPYMLKRHMLGVGSGDAPPDIHFCDREPLPRSDHHSFGNFRSDLIYKALRDSTESIDFFELIVKNFKDAGIDANDPSIQTRFQELEQQSILNLMQKHMPYNW
ncbi:MAG: hypothetical protein KAH18_12885 [Psychromonas sp.]|nr:hypothetical protein [Psychromonas sp.]